LLELATRAIQAALVLPVYKELQAHKVYKVILVLVEQLVHKVYRVILVLQEAQVWLEVQEAQDQLDQLVHKVFKVTLVVQEAQDQLVIQAVLVHKVYKEMLEPQARKA
jgi:hypothetical protein